MPPANEERHDRALETALDTNWSNGRARCQGRAVSDGHLLEADMAQSTGNQLGVMKRISQLWHCFIRGVPDDERNPPVVIR